MKKSKKPAPRRAGTRNMKGEPLEQLNWLRVNRPRSYDQLMVALAQMVAVARVLDD